MVSGAMDPSYWLNWRFSLCAIWVLSSMAVASILVWKYEGSKTDGTEGGEARHGKMGTLYEDEAWRPCLSTIHPVWLLVFRVIAFVLFVALLVVNIVVDGASILYYYTQWTFMLVTIYFGLGSLLSAYGCYQYISKVSGDRIERMRLDSEHSSHVSSMNGETGNGSHTVKNPMLQDDRSDRKPAGLGGYLFQIIYQTNAGAVMLTDFVFWLIIFPFLALKDYNLNFLQIGMHSINAVFLLADTALNCLIRSFFMILLAIPLVPNCIFPAMDINLRDFSVGLPFLQINLVALSISRLVISSCPHLVLCRGSFSCTLLCRLLFNNEAEALFAYEMVSSVLLSRKLREAMLCHFSSVLCQ